MIMTKAYILESGDKTSICDIRIENHTRQDFIIVEDGNVHIELKIYPTKDIEKINEKWLDVIESIHEQYKDDE